MGAMLFCLRALQSEEASAVAPFFQASPLFGYARGYLVLGETLTGIQFAGAALIVGGGARSLPRRPRFNLRLVSLMLACALSLVVSALVFKLFSLRDEFWPTTFWMLAGEALFGAGLLMIASYRNEFFRLLDRCLEPAMQYFSR